MSRQLLLVAHGESAQVLVDQARTLIGSLPMPTHCVAFHCEDNPGDIIQQTLKTLDQSDEIVIITDLFGSTPSNIAHTLAEAISCSVVHGLNLAMLIRAFNYAELPLNEWTEHMMEGARRAIFRGNTPP